MPAPADGTLTFLEFGAHSYGPDMPGARRGESRTFAPFQQLRATRWTLPAPSGGSLTIERSAKRDAFWDQLITVDESQLGPAPRYRLIESAEFAASLPAKIRAIDLSNEELARMQSRLDDPIIPVGVKQEIPWSELERAAWPLDFQKVLLADAHDNHPAFAFENGQWLTTWKSVDLPGSGKEDHWFAPALLIGDVLVRPAPLSARTSWLKSQDGTTLPLWVVEWSHEGTHVRQEMFSLRSCVFTRITLSGKTAGVRVAIGTGRRPNIHYWDDPKAPERTPIPFFTQTEDLRREGRRALNRWHRATLVAAQPFSLEALGPVETVLVFEPDAQGRVTVFTPQVETNTGLSDYDQARAEFLANWTIRLGAGMRVRLPDANWQERIDLWRYQVEAITRVHFIGPSSDPAPNPRERLSYGAYSYLDYFGIEEGWTIVALALWGRPDEAKRQAEIMLDAEALDKAQVHHQYRNGIAAMVGATVALLTQDRAWLAMIAPTLLECAAWTAASLRETADGKNPTTRGLLRPHIYGGDVRDPATSLYSTVTCWRGLVDTANAFRALGSPELVREGERLAREAAALHARLDEVIAGVTVHTTTPPFVPFALDIPSLGGRNEGPYESLPDSLYGTYWILFAPMFLEMDFRSARQPELNRWIFDYAQTHGGLWAGLPRFTTAIDAAYAIGYIAHVVDRSVDEPGLRPQAIAALHAFMLHAASRNAHTIPEAAGLFPYRLQRAPYEMLARENPWNFGMYDGQRYVQGHLSFTEPLGAGAGEALWLIRRMLVNETRDAAGQLDGGLFVLTAVPEAWLAEGKEITLRHCVTPYGLFSATVRSRISSRREITIEHSFAAFDPATAHLPRLQSIRVRLAVPGEALRETELKEKLTTVSYR